MLTCRAAAHLTAADALCIVNKHDVRLSEQELADC